MNKDFVAIIPAAGTSERFLGEIPKQFIKVDGRSILELSLIPSTTSEIKIFLKHFKE